MPGPERLVRRSIRISRENLDRARKILGTTTDAETVDAALDLVVFRDEVLKGVRRIAGSNSMRDIYAEDIRSRSADDAAATLKCGTLAQY
ncbi:MAG TPA: hypothetical protein VGO40_03965 [Longimicrobium sp.]|jgi:hypothetical protein|nr:hypothetical protein [Longimicrobium sp.]